MFLKRSAVLANLYPYHQQNYNLKKYSHVSKQHLDIYVCTHIPTLSFRQSYDESCLSSIVHVYLIIHVIILCVALLTSHYRGCYRSIINISQHKSIYVWLMSCRWNPGDVHNFASNALRAIQRSGYYTHPNLNPQLHYTHCSVTFKKRTGCI